MSSTGVSRLIWAVIILSMTVSWTQSKDSYWSYQRKFPYGEFPKDVENVNFMVIDMTVEIIKDLHLRIDHASRFVEMHKGSINFELGFIAAEIHDRFKQMLLRYKALSSRAGYDKSLADHVQNLEYIEGLYNEILHQRRMYHKLMDDYEAAQRNTPAPEMQSDLPESLMDKFHLNDPSLTKLMGGRRRDPLLWAPRNPMKINSVTKTPHKIKRGTTPSDYEYRKNLRQMAFDKKRGNFIPQNEGIDINLYDIL